MSNNVIRGDGGKFAGSTGGGGHGAGWAKAVARLGKARARLKDAQHSHSLHESAMTGRQLGNRKKELLRAIKNVNSMPSHPHSQERLQSLFRKSSVRASGLRDDHMFASQDHAAAKGSARSALRQRMKITAKRLATHEKRKASLGARLD